MYTIKGELFLDVTAEKSFSRGRNHGDHGNQNKASASIMSTKVAGTD